MTTEEEYWKEYHNKMETLTKYNKKHVTTINFEEKTLIALRHLRDTKHLLSVSDGVRQLVKFALPYFLTTAHTIDKILKNNLKNFSFENPRKTIEKLRIAEIILKDKKLSLKELKRKYPNEITYRDMNEE